MQTAICRRYRIVAEAPEAPLSRDSSGGWFGICWGYIGIMEKKMEAIEITGVIYGLYRDYRGLYWGYIGIAEKKMETTIMVIRV